MKNKSISICQLEELCKQKFKEVNGLYRPEDKFDISIQHPDCTTPIFFVCYTSSKWSEELSEEERDARNLPYGGMTSIDFKVLEDHPDMGYINFLNVNENCKGNGFGKGMVQAMEKILKKTDKIAVCSEEITNPEFWKHMGYTLTKYNDSGSGYFTGIKVL